MALSFAANLSFLYQERPFDDRFLAAAESGFKGCEFLFSHAHSPDKIARWLDEASIELALFNLYPGDWDSGERGLAALLGREAEFRQSVDLALEFARAASCKRLHIMAGNAQAAANKEAKEAYIGNLAYAAEQFSKADVTGLIDTINPVDMLGYFLSDFDEALKILVEIGSPNLKLRFDCYHWAMIGQDIIEGLKQTIEHIAHIQIADCSGRHEPGSGDVQLPAGFSVAGRAKLHRNAHRLRIPFDR